jgi:hypothetical protein
LQAWCCAAAELPGPVRDAHPSTWNLERDVAAVSSISCIRLTLLHLLDRCWPISAGFTGQVLLLRSPLWCGMARILCNDCEKRGCLWTPASQPIAALTSDCLRPATHQPRTCRLRSNDVYSSRIDSPTPLSSAARPSGLDAQGLTAAAAAAATSDFKRSGAPPPSENQLGARTEDCCACFRSRVACLSCCGMRVFARIASVPPRWHRARSRGN